MPTLYVENVPEDLYHALRTRAKENRNSISAEVLKLLAENIPTAEELERRKECLNRARVLRAQPPAGPGPFHTTEELQREDRNR